MADEEYETPSPTQAELNAMNRAVFGIEEEKPKATKDDKSDDAEGKAADAEKPATYKTRASKAD